MVTMGAPVKLSGLFTLSPCFFLIEQMVKRLLELETCTIHSFRLGRLTLSYAGRLAGSSNWERENSLDGERGRVRIVRIVGIVGGVIAAGG